MSDDKNQLISQLIDIFDDLLKEAGWDSSFLLKVSKKRLLKAKEQLEQIKAQESSADNAEKTIRQSGVSQDQMVVFVSLYQAGGHNINLWEQMLKVLSSCSLGRPIYANEADVRAMIEQRPDLQKEAYVEVIVNQSALVELPQSKVPKDGLGASLLVLKPNSINMDCVRMFTHANQMQYHFLSGKLILIK